MRDFHASEGNTFSDHVLRCAVEGRVLLTKEQAQAIEDHLDCVATSVDALLWAYCGRCCESEAAALEQARAHYDEMILVMDPWDGGYPTGPRP